MQYIILMAINKMLIFNTFTALYKMVAIKHIERVIIFATLSFRDLKNLYYLIPLKKYELFTKNRRNFSLVENLYQNNRSFWQ